MLRAQCRILDPHRLYRYNAARVAFYAMGIPKKVHLDKWLEACIREAVKDCLVEDEQSERGTAVQVAATAQSYEIMTEFLGIDPLLARLAMLTFNRLPEPDRKLLFPVLVDGTSLVEMANRTESNLAEVERRFERLLREVSNPIAGRIPNPAPDEWEDLWPNG